MPTYKFILPSPHDHSVSDFDLSNYQTCRDVKDALQETYSDHTWPKVRGRVNQQTAGALCIVCRWTALSQGTPVPTPARHLPLRQR